MRKLLTSLVVVVLAAIVVMGWSISEYATQHSTPSQKEHTQSQIEALKLVGVSLAHTFDDTRANQQELIVNWNRHNDEQLSIVSEATFSLPPLLQAKFQEEGTLVLESDEGIDFYYQLPNTANVLNIQTHLHSVENDNALSNSLYTTLFYGGIVLILLLWVSPLIKQLLNLAKVTTSFGMGDLQQRIVVNKSSYIADIEIEFNRMADRISQLVDDNKLLSRAVSHDLKTPIARLRFGIEALEETDSEKLRIKYFARINNDLDAMEELVSTLLNYARLEQSNISPNLESIELNAWLENKLSKPLSLSHQIDFIPHPQPLHVMSDPKYLSMQVANLLSNAERFGQSKIRVKLQQRGQDIELSIDDDGNGIDEQEIENVIKPFVRGSQSRDNAGHGMGLAIVIRIGVWMGSELAIHRSPDLGGASMRLTFKANK